MKLYGVFPNAGTDSCRYSYIQQPQRNLLCNPHIRRELITECEVRYGSREVAVNIVWVFLPSQSSTSFLIRDGGKYSITPGSSNSLARSRLEVDQLTETDVGAYVCQIEFRNGTLTTSSQSLMLLTSDISNSRRFAECSESEAQSVRVETCALRGNIGSGLPRPGNLDGGENIRNGDGGGGDGDSSGGGPDSFVIWTIVGALGGFIVLAIVVIIFIVCVQQCCCRPSPY